MVRGALRDGRLLALTLAASVAGCPAFPDARCANEPCAQTSTSDDAGTTAPADARSPSETGAGLDASARDDDPALALHVAPQGSDASGDGTRERPFRTVARALAAATGEDVSLHLCAARFEESLAVTSPTRRLAITGGFACPNASNPWQSGAGETAIAGTSSNAHRFEVRALRVRSLRIEALDARADSGASSIAVDVRTSDGAAFDRALVVAGNGSAGSAGVAATSVAAAGLDGRAAVGSAGGIAPERTCGTAVFSRGGSGGSGAGGSTRGASGSTSAGVAGNAGSSGDEATSRNCSAGGRGADGTTRPVVGDASDELQTDTLVAAAGRSGNDGDPGQGGGGGGTASAREGAPSGASGGCGGAGGAGGNGGGSSVAIVVRSGSLVLMDTQLRTGDGGGGGAGARGSNGAPGGRGINLNEGATAGPCSSGDGGYGAGGAGGEGGHGGAAIGVLALAAGAVTVDGEVITASRDAMLTTTLGRAGVGGAAGSGGGGASSFTPLAGRVGKDGLRQAIRFVTVR